jgi:ADP-ribose pyrophosphatase YjhB (NUDIX family)
MGKINIKKIDKIGLLILNKTATKFLVVQKSPDNITGEYIIPGGRFEENTVDECLKNEIREELNCQINLNSLKYIGEYSDKAAGRFNTIVFIKLYQGKIIGEPKPTTEIKFLHWIGKNDMNNKNVSAIIRNQIIPDLVKKKILN